MLLPQGGLAISVASTVWVGAIIVCILNLCLGWSLTGLVIPGFLVPIFIIMPVVAVVNIIEGILTYLLIKFIIIKLVSYQKIDSIFGRERFFIIIVTSIVVRLVSDYFILPHLAEFLQNSYNYQFDYYTNLNSYGIIIIALIANQLWKEGLIKSFIPLTVTIALTYLLVRYGLMEFTNFRISQVETLYFNITEIFAGSSKAYIILLVTTLIALKMTKNHGWDYGGVLVVGLLALQWYSPTRIGITLFEALVIYIVSSFLLGQNFIARYNIVEAKKILLFFNVGFLYRLILGDIVMGLFPEERVIEYYGFGYMLSTLIALKIHNDKSVIRSVFMIIWTSFWGFIIGSIVALLLYFITDASDKHILQLGSLQEVQVQSVKEQSGYLAGLIESYREEMAVYSKVLLLQPELKEILMIDQFVLTPLAESIFHATTIDVKLKTRLAGMNDYAGLFGYELILFNDLLSHDHFIFLVPRSEETARKNWGFYIFRLNYYNDRIIQVPRPYDEVNSLGFAIFLFQKIKAGFLFIGGNYSNVNQDRSSDLTRPAAKYNLYNIVNQVFLRDYQYENLMIQIRGYGLSINNTATPDKDVLIAFSDGAGKPSQLTKKQEDVVRLITDQKLSYGLVTDDEQTAGYGVGELFLSRYLLQTPNKDLAIIWLSPNLRKNFTNPENNYSVLSHYQILNILTVRDSLVNFLARSKITYDWKLPDGLENLFDNYLKTQDIIILQNITEIKNYKFTHLILTDDGMDYLAIYDLMDNLLGFISLREQVEDKTYNITEDEKPRGDLSTKRWVTFKKRRGR